MNDSMAPLSHAKHIDYFVLPFEGDNTLNRSTVAVTRGNRGVSAFVRNTRAQAGSVGFTPSLHIAVHLKAKFVGLTKHQRRVAWDGLYSAIQKLLCFVTGVVANGQT